MRKRTGEFYGVYENEKKIAYIDRTEAHSTMVVLFLPSGRYVQKFFIDSTDADMIEGCREMLKLGIPSLR